MKSVPTTLPHKTSSDHLRARSTWYLDHDSSQKDGHVPALAHLLQRQLREDERCWAKNTRVDVDHVLVASGVDQYIDTKQAKEATAVKRGRDRFCGRTNKTFQLVLTRDLRQRECSVDKLWCQMEMLLVALSLKILTISSILGMGLESIYHNRGPF